MKTTTVTVIMNILSGRVAGMLGQLSKVAPSALPGLTTEIDETTTALTDFARHQHDTNGAEINAGIAAIGVLVDHQHELAELDKFFETGSGRGTRAHKMVKALVRLANDSKPETLNQPA
jgi:hypothetical protein